MGERGRFSGFGLLPARTIRIDAARILVTVFDSAPEPQDTIWTSFTDKDRELGLVPVKVGNEIRILDIDGQDRPQRWWKVKAIVEAEKMQTVPIYWDGPASELPVQYTMVDPALPDRVVLVRLADRGPWARMELIPANPPETRGAQ